METKEMQKKVDDWIKTNTPGYWKLLSQMARLTEEVGELAREINHRYGEKTKKSTEEEKEMVSEIGDVLYILICIANSTGVDLGDAFTRVLEKYEKRDKNRWR
jgi:NTP pyrophosphatase (non-canonical NTP hydrolase)